MPRHLGMVLLLTLVCLPLRCAAVFCGGPPAGEEDGGGLSMQALAERPAGMLSCAAGYWAEKCGDHATAHKIFDKCIAAGYVGAMIWKALLLEDGAGVERDEVRATELLKRAAMSGDDHYATLGKLHYASNLYLGRGVAKDEAEARKWFQAAAAEGSKEAADFLRTGYHTGARDQSGHGIGTPPAEQHGQLLSRVERSDAPALPAWTLLLVAALVAAGAAGRALRSHARWAA